MIINSNKIEVVVNDKVLSNEEYDLTDNVLTFKKTPEIGDKIVVRKIEDNG